MACVERGGGREGKRIMRDYAPVTCSPTRRSRNRKFARGDIVFVHRNRRSACDTFLRLSTKEEGDDVRVYVTPSRISTSRESESRHP